MVQTAAAANSTDRIVGGEPAKNGAYPEFVLLQILVKDSNSTRDSTCGGTLIAKNIVLTAAHCVEDSDGLVVSGGTAYKGNIRTREKNGKTKVTAEHQSEFKKWVLHPKYGKQGVGGYDIAVAVLDKSLPKPFAKLPKAERVPPTGAKVTVVGFGANNNFLVPVEDGITPVEGSLSNKLYEVTLTVGKDGTLPCPKMGYPKNNPFAFTPKRELCYYGDEFSTTEEENFFYNGGVGIKNDCNGDSGGPSFYNGVQYGLVSRGGDTFCGNLFRSPYTIHTKTSAHVKHFIRRMLEKYAK